MMPELRHAAGQALLAFLVLWPFDPTAGLGLALIIWVGVAARKWGKKSERVPNHHLSFPHQGRGLSGNKSSHEVASLGPQGRDRKTAKSLLPSSAGPVDDFDLREEPRCGCECFE